MKYRIDNSKISGNEYEINIYLHKDEWALPLFISVWKHGDGLMNACLDMSIHILCVSIQFEWWKWK